MCPSTHVKRSYPNGATYFVRLSNGQIETDAATIARLEGLFEDVECEEVSGKVIPGCCCPVCLEKEVPSTWQLFTLSWEPDEVTDTVQITFMINEEGDDPITFAGPTVSWQAYIDGVFEQALQDALATQFSPLPLYDLQTTVTPDSVSWELHIDAAYVDAVFLDHSGGDSTQTGDGNGPRMFTYAVKGSQQHFHSDIDGSIVSTVIYDENCQPIEDATVVPCPEQGVPITTESCVQWTETFRGEFWQYDAFYEYEIDEGDPTDLPVNNVSLQIVLDDGTSWTYSENVNTTVGEWFQETVVAQFIDDAFNRSPSYVPSVNALLSTNLDLSAGYFYTGLIFNPIAGVNTMVWNIDGQIRNAPGNVPTSTYIAIPVGKGRRFVTCVNGEIIEEKVVDDIGNIVIPTGPLVKCRETVDPNTRILEDILDELSEPVTQYTTTLNSVFFASIPTTVGVPANVKEMVFINNSDAWLRVTTSIGPQMVPPRGTAEWSVDDNEPGLAISALTVAAGTFGNQDHFAINYRIRS